jgi:hypothetical protein
MPRPLRETDIERLLRAGKKTGEIQRELRVSRNSITIVRRKLGMSRETIPPQSVRPMDDRLLAMVIHLEGLPPTQRRALQLRLAKVGNDPGLLEGAA